MIQFTQWWIQDFPDGSTISKGGHQPIIWQIFAEKCIKQRILGWGGHAHTVPPRSAKVTLSLWKLNAGPKQQSPRRCVTL